MRDFLNQSSVTDTLNSVEKLKNVNSAAKDTASNAIRRLARLDQVAISDHRKAGELMIFYIRRSFISGSDLLQLGNRRREVFIELEACFHLNFRRKSFSLIVFQCCRVLCQQPDINMVIQTNVFIFHD